jgi:transposase
MLYGMAKTIIRHQEGLLADYCYPISTGHLEGTNNIIKTMKRHAYGYRDHEFFMLKIFAIHQSKYALVG